MNADQVIFTDDDESASVAAPTTDISFFEGITRRGPYNDPSIIITSLAQFRKIFGGQINTSDFPALCERVINAGGLLRINRIGHYTDITDASTLSATKAVLQNVMSSAGTPQPLFKAQPKNAGADTYAVKVLAPTNGLSASGYFNLQVTVIGDETNATELFQNLKITADTIANATWLNGVNSVLMDFNYLDLHTGITSLIPAVQTLSFTTGTAGGAIVSADYVGDPGAKTGLFAFDPYDDGMQVAVPEVSDSTVNIALANYADGRGEIEALMHIDEALTAVSDIITARQAITKDTKYASAFCGGIIDVNGNQLSEIADICIIANYVDENYGPWFSGANWKRGSISNAKGVINNFGSAGQLGDRNLLAQNQVNPVVAANNHIYPASNLSFQVENTLASFRSVARLLIYLKKSLRPTLTAYLEEPPDLITFLNLYQEVEPFLDNLTARRAFVKGGGVSKKGYDWNGDQFAPSLQQLTVNNIDDLNNGQYKINFVIYPQGVITGIDMGIVLSTSAGVSFTS